jgi:hypothetical protein
MEILLHPTLDHDAFAAHFNAVLCGSSSDGEVKIIDRTPNDYTSRACTEIIRCSFPDGTERRVLCKYFGPNLQSATGLVYEAEVYRDVVQPSGLSAPKYYGSYFDKATGKGWMLLEYIDDALLLNEVWDPGALRIAAQWLGKFHAIQEGRLASDELKFLKVYDSDYYLGLARSAMEFATDSLDDFPWLPLLCDRFEEVVIPLLSRSPTVAHEDYHPHNLLYREEKVYPIDWEFAGIDLGEMDLACLTDALPEEVARDCQLEYQKSRWPDGAPSDFEQTVAAGRLCLYFHNLGTRPDWTTDPHRLWCSEQLHATAEQMGLLT